MKKSDLENRMVVEIRDGRRYMVVDDILIRDSGYVYIDDYDEDLTEKDGYEQFDIVKVFSYINKTSDIKNARVDLLWKRPWKPEIDDTYYMIDLQKRDLYRCEEWEDDLFDNEWYDKGLVFKTKEEAIEMAEKMLELTKGDK